MSDGPFKSAKVRRHWRDVAEIACNPAFSRQEKQDSVERAIKREFEDVPNRKVLKIIRGEAQGSLPLEIEREKIAELEKLRCQRPGSATFNSLIDCAIEVVIDGRCGIDAELAAMTNSVEEVLRSSFRSLTEHAVREAGDRNSKATCEVLEAAADMANPSAIASELISAEPSTPRTRRASKQTGVEQGPTLP